jgi:hypothetical protein
MTAMGPKYNAQLPAKNKTGYGLEHQTAGRIFYLYCMGCLVRL